MLQRKLDIVKEAKSKLAQKVSDSEQSASTRNELTSLSYTEIKKRFDSDKITAFELLEAYQDKALSVDKELNCLTDVFPIADDIAKALDNVPKKERKRLHGIPVSVKDSIALAGYDATFGCLSRCLKPDKETTCILQALINEGMVPFVRTNMSQCAMLIECINPVFGETCNPLDHSRTCGGSSGGDAALVAGGGGLVGIGTDAGGSNRIPSYYCGIYGFKPTSRRLGGKKLPRLEASIDPVFVRESLGPLSSDFELLVDIMKVLFSPALFDLDRQLPRLHFDTEIYESKQPLTIGYYTSFDDPSVAMECVPCVVRAVKETVEALKQRGHTLVPWQPPRIARAFHLCLKSFFLDGMKGMNQFAKQEGLLAPELKDSTNLGRHGYLTKSLMLKMAPYFISPLQVNFLDGARGVKTVTDVIDLSAQLEEYFEECESSINDANLDGFIGPVLPFVAPPLGQTKDVMFGGIYTMIYNFLDYASGVVPVSKVTKEDIETMENEYPNETDIHRAVRKTQTGSEGLPIAVQCASIRWRDEVALRIMREVKETATNL